MHPQARPCGTTIRVPHLSFPSNTNLTISDEPTPPGGCSPGSRRNQTAAEFQQLEAIPISCKVADRRSTRTHRVLAALVAAALTTGALGSIIDLEVAAGQSAIPPAATKVGVATSTGSSTEVVGGDTVDWTVRSVHRSALDVDPGDPGEVGRGAGHRAGWHLRLLGVRPDPDSR